MDFLKFSYYTYKAYKMVFFAILHFHEKTVKNILVDMQWIIKISPN